MGQSIASLREDIGALARPDGAERLSMKLRQLRHAIGQDPASLKAVATRDDLCGALVKLSTEPLSPPLRRQLALCMALLGDLEPRAIIALVDALLASLTALSKDAKSSSAPSTASRAQVRTVISISLPFPPSSLSFYQSVQQTPFSVSIHTFDLVQSLPMTMRDSKLPSYLRQPSSRASETSGPATAACAHRVSRKWSLSLVAFGVPLTPRRYASRPPRAAWPRAKGRDRCEESPSHRTWRWSSRSSSSR